MTRDTTEACLDRENWKGFQCDDPENYVHETYGSARTIYLNMINLRDLRSLKQFRENDDETFYFAILYGVYFKLKGPDADFSDDL